MPCVQLVPFEPRHLVQLEEWLAEPTVRRYWGEPEEPLAVARDLPERYGHALITDGDEPAGYVRWARCDAALLASVGVADLPDGSVDIDILLGSEATRGRGIGVAALQLLADRLFAEGAPLLSLISSVENRRAHAAFVKAGWRDDRPYRDDTFGDCRLFLREPSG